MSRKASRQQVGVALFPFLAVLICTMGALIVLLVLLVQQARVDASTIAAQQTGGGAAGGGTPQFRERLEDAQWQRELLEKSRGEKAEELTKSRARLAHLEEHIQRLEAQARELMDRARSIDEGKKLRAEDLAAARAEAARLKAEIDKKKKELDEAKKKNRDGQDWYALIPYDGRSGTRRRPIYIECTEIGVIIQPEGLLLRASDFTGPLGPGNPLDVALRAIREHIERTVGDKAGQPYPLLVVRPTGILAFTAARGAMKAWDDEFGYELISDDKQLDFGPPDPALAAALNKTVTVARQRQAAIIAMMPRRFQGEEPLKSFAYEPSPESPSSRYVGSGGGLGNGSGAGVTGPGAAGGAGGVGGRGAGNGPGGTGGNGPGGSATPGSRGLPGNGPGGFGNGNGFGGAGGFGGNGGYGGSGPYAAGANGRGASGTGGPAGGNGNASAGGNGFGNGSAGGGAGASGGILSATAAMNGGSNGDSLALAGRNAAARGEAPILGSPDGAGAGSFTGSGNGNGSGGGDGSGTGSGGSQSSGGPSGAGGGSSSTGGGQNSGGSTGAQGGSQDSGGGQGGGSGAPGGGGSTAAGSSSQMGGQAGGSPMSMNQGGMAAPNLNFNFGQKNQPQAQAGGTSPTKPPPRSSAHRGKNWALPDAKQHHIGVTRPIHVTVLGDRLMILPERGDDRPPQVVKVAPELSPDDVNHFVTAVQSEVKGWGLAVADGYWKPVVQAEVAPEAERHFMNLQSGLQGSGIEIMRR